MGTLKSTLWTPMEVTLKTSPIILRMTLLLHGLESCFFNVAPAGKKLMIWGRLKQVD